MTLDTPRTFETDGRWCKHCGKGITEHRGQVYCPSKAGDSELRSSTDASVSASNAADLERS